MWPHGKNLTRFCGTGLVTLSASLAPPALAEDGQEERVLTLPAVVVSGEKMERGVEDTASSVAILPAKDLSEKTKGASSVAEALSDVPNVVYTGTVGAPIIRGQDTQGPNFGSTAFFGGTIPRATINLDGHYQNYYEYVFGTTSIWDVESIEVFRGPQTTSQGANAIAGAIIVNTKDPTFKPEASYQAEIGSYARRRTSLAVSGPLVGEQLAGRMAIDYSGRDTFVDYVNKNFAQGDTDQDLQSLSARGKLLWVPDALPGLTTKLTYSFGSANRPTWESASAPYDDLDNSTLSMPSWSQHTHTGVADVAYDFENGLKLVNQTQYSDTGVKRITEPKNNGTAKIDQNTISNELRVNYGGATSPLSGMAGLYLARTVSDDVLYIRGTSRFDDEKQNLGLFSEVSYRLGERWTLTGGLRYQRDHVQRSGTSSYARQALDYDESFDAFLPKVSLAYDVTPEVTVGAMINRGYNPGGVNLSFASSRYITFDPETVWNYELFTRARLLNDRLTLNGNLFYSRHADSQRLLPDYLNGVQYGSVVVNADQAQSYGLELGMDYKMLESVRVRAGAGLLQTHIGSFTGADGTSYEGNEFGRAPSYTLSLGADWDILPQVRLSGEVRHTDGYFSTDENISAYAVDGYTVANARLSYAPREYFQVYVFANNIFDKRAPAYLYDDRTAGGIVANTIEPRMIGVGIKGTF